jgi:hypothetical protein
MGQPKCTTFPAMETFAVMHLPILGAKIYVYIISAKILKAFQCVLPLSRRVAFKAPIDW